MTVTEALRRRRAIKHFDPTHQLTDEDIHGLIAPTLRTPTAFNLQHGRLVVVRDRAIQHALYEAAFRQVQVRDCSAVILVLAKLDAHEDAPRAWASAPPTVAAGMIRVTSDLYADDARLRRDEAIRSGSLLSMSLMLVATEMALDTCPLIGFDTAAVHRILDIPEDHAVVLMVCVGRAARPPYPELPRFPANEVVRLDRFDGPELPPPAPDPDAD